jgi:Skp family chaperone for outer membrane proteins
MKVVEKDKVISGILKDEFKRCREILTGLQKSLKELRYKEDETPAFLKKLEQKKKIEKEVQSYKKKLIICQNC